MTASLLLFAVVMGMAAAVASPGGKSSGTPLISLKWCSIALGPDAGPGERFAATELSLFGGNISNGNVPLQVHGNATPPALADGLAPRPGADECTIAVGYAAAIAAGLALAGPASLSSTNKNDGYIIASIKPNAWAITGAKGSARGALYGVYEFLERLGWRHLAWDLDAYPVGSPHAPALLSPALHVVQTEPPSVCRGTLTPQAPKQPSQCPKS